VNVVVVGVDRSETARSAAYAAARLAKAYGTSLHLVTCAEPTPPDTKAVGSDRVRTDWVDHAEHFLARLADEVPHDAVTWSVSTGDPASVIVEEAERLGAGTIVVGNVRVQGLSRVLGSVAASVMRKAPCDVLIAHTS
jgi:nucleotide-binding universal stress UspA family protein